MHEITIDMPDEKRELERIRLVSTMTMRSVQQGNTHGFPVELIGSIYQAIALIDLVWNTAPRGRVAILLAGFQGMPENQDLIVQRDLGELLNSNGGLVEVRSPGEIYALRVRWDTQVNAVVCDFGYTVNGLTIYRPYPHAPVSVNLSGPASTEAIVDLSLFQLYKMTGNVKFLDAVGRRKSALLANNGAQSVPVVDPMGYFTVLGLNPYMARFMSASMINSIIKFAKRGLASQLHSDLGNRSEQELDYLKQALAAADFLEDESKRNDYCVWL